MWEPALIIILLSVFALYGLGVFFTLVIQDRFIFLPSRLPQNHKFRSPYPFEEVFLDRPDGSRVHGIHFKVKEARGLVLYFHGNRGSLSRWIRLAEDYVERGYELMIVDYRGYGKSVGNKSEHGFHEDAMAWYDYCREYFPDKQLFVLGRSIGSGVASRLAANRKPATLILETPYSTIGDLFHAYYPFLPRIFPFKFKFHSMDALQSVQCPVYVIHGTRDRVVPYRLGKKLAASRPDVAQLITIQGGAHSNLRKYPGYHQELGKILNSMPEYLPQRPISI